MVPKETVSAPDRRGSLGEYGHFDVRGRIITFNEHRSDAEQYYRNEVQVLRSLDLQGSSLSMIGFYGSFQKGQTYSLIFEYADGGTLEDYFRKDNRPAKDEDINKFWRRLFDLIPLAQAIRRLQKTNYDSVRNLSTWVSLHRGCMKADLLTVLDGTKKSDHKTFLLPTLRMEQATIFTSNSRTSLVNFKVESQVYQLLMRHMVS